MSGVVIVACYTVESSEVRAVTIRPAIVNSLVALACLGAAYAIVVLVLGFHNCW